MAIWIAWCNGGPNDTMIGDEYPSLGKAIGALEKNMKNLVASVGGIQKKTGKLEEYPVADEESAGKIISECVGCEFVDIECAENCSDCPAWKKVQLKLKIDDQGNPIKKPRVRNIDECVTCTPIDDHEIQETEGDE